MENSGFRFLLRRNSYKLRGTIGTLHLWCTYGKLGRSHKKCAHSGNFLVRPVETSGPLQREKRGKEKEEEEKRGGKKRKGDAEKCLKTCLLFFSFTRQFLSLWPRIIGHPLALWNSAVPPFTMWQESSVFFWWDRLKPVGRSKEKIVVTTKTRLRVHLAPTDSP